MDLRRERLHGEFLHRHRMLLRAATDLSDGGLALAAFEMAHRCGCGVTLATDDPAFLFGEDQARYLLAVPPDAVAPLLAAGTAEDVPVREVGRFGGDSVRFGDMAASFAALDEFYRTAFEKAVA